MEYGSLPRWGVEASDAFFHHLTFSAPAAAFGAPMTGRVYANDYRSKAPAPVGYRGGFQGLVFGQPEAVLQRNGMKALVRAADIHSDHDTWK
jgi:hypothetical protein